MAALLMLFGELPEKPCRPVTYLVSIPSAAQKGMLDKMPHLNKDISITAKIPNTIPK